MRSYFTDEELDAVQHLHKRAPYAISGISHSVFSLARYRGMTYQDCSYMYMADTDECVRADVVAAVEKLRRKAAKAAKAAGKQVMPAEQPSLDL